MSHGTETGAAAGLFAARCGLDGGRRAAAVARMRALIAGRGVERVRVAWCDVHGLLRGKTLMPRAALAALDDGIGMVSTLLLKDTSDRTAFKVFEPGGVADLPGFEFAGNLMLLPDPETFRELPWSPGTGWVRAQAWMPDGGPVEFETRRVLQHALERLHSLGYGLTCGLEVEFHIYRIESTRDQLDPAQAAWPGPVPAVSMIHPGYGLLDEAWADMAEEPLRIVQRTADALGLPLASLEIEFGPSQVEAVFEATDALTAADNMVVFRSAVRQALRRAGYHATFMCRPPFPNIMSSGWHLHQSLTHVDTGLNAMRRDHPAEGAGARDAAATLSEVGEHYLAGLLEHARAAAVFCTPTTNGFGRFRPNALAPQAVLWGRDNRGAMLRVIGRCGDSGTRIENRVGEPAANPYLYLASQVHSGIDGMERKLKAPPATDSPYDPTHRLLPTTLPEALAALDGDTALRTAFGAPFIDYYLRLKRSEADRHALAESAEEFERREYFARF